MERLYRPHRGSLAEAMKEVRKIDNVEHLVMIVRESLADWYPETDMVEIVNVNTLRSKKSVYDARIKWDTHLLCLDGWGVVGQINFDFNEAKKNESTT